MGTHRKPDTDDITYNARRAYYLEHKPELMQRAKERYARDKDIHLEIARRVRAEVRNREKTTRLAQKRLDFYTSINKPVPKEEWLKQTDKKRKLIWDLKESVPCMDCNIKYPYYVMDFDHVRGEKFRDISDLIHKGTNKQLTDEIAKCDVVCSNCHRQRTFTRVGGHVSDVAFPVLTVKTS